MERQVRLHLRLHGTPTTFILEERLAALEGGLQCLLVPSGLAAIANVALSLLRTGDEVLIPTTPMGQTRRWRRASCRPGASRTGSTTPWILPIWRPRSDRKTRLVWLEAAGSVTLEFPDLVEQVRICRARGVVAALDNTWGAGLAFDPFDLAPAGEAPLAVDVSVHALTKYPSGGWRRAHGSIVTRDEALHLRLN